MSARQVSLTVPVLAAALATVSFLWGTIGFVAWFSATTLAGLCLFANLRWAQMIDGQLAHLADLAKAWQAGTPARDPIRAIETAFANVARQMDWREQQARAEKGQLQAVLSGMVEGVIVLDRSGTIQLANQHAARLFGARDPHGLVGTPILTLSRDPDLHRLVRTAAANVGDEALFAEIVIDTGERDEVLQVSASAVGGEQPLSILVFHDVTELKRLEATRRDFVANVSHEIRTPLTAIRGYAETLRAGAMDDADRARHFLGVIERHSERLSRLTDDLLALSDLELGRAALHKAPMSIAPAVEAALDVVRDRAARSGVTLGKSIPPDLSTLLADSDRVVQVLVNLVDNAVKYTERGGSVTVTAHRAERPEVWDAVDEPNWLELRVEDTGIGIPSRDLPRLTERFYRVDKARSRELGGTGLGLAIVKHIVQAHAGILRIESELNKGTTVRVYLPITSPES